MRAPDQLPAGFTPTVVSDEPLPRGGPEDFTPPRPEALAVLFPQLEIFSLLGYGGMGAVYQARQRGLDRVVALKILPFQYSRDAGFAERFAREARALARLNHPNIVAVYDFGEAGRIYYFLMEFVDGVNLRQMLESHRLTPAGGAGHRAADLRGARNTRTSRASCTATSSRRTCWWTTKGRVKIADFGVAETARPRRQTTRS